MQQPVRVSLSSSPPGAAHTKSTIKKMSELAREGSETYEIRHLATEITRNVPSRSPRAELVALYQWVRDHIRYRYDPLELEWVQSPWRTVLEQAGDCDDLATLIAALAGSLGHPWRFRTVGKTETAQSHVAVQVWDREKWVDLDPVLEPTQPTTAPRADLGMFGCRALGADIHWSQEGTMMGAPRRSRVQVSAHSRAYPFMHGWPGELAAPASLRMVELANGALSGRVSASEAATLWRWSPSFPPLEPARSFGPPYTGPAPADFRYRSHDAPGFFDGKAITFALPSGALPEHALNGFGVYPEPIYHQGLGKWGILKKVAKIAKKGTELVRKVTKSAPFQAFESIMEKVPVVGTFVQLHREYVDPLIQAALDASNAKGKGGAVKALVKGAGGVALKAATNAGAGGKAVALVKPAAVALAKPAAKAVALVKPAAKAVAVVKQAAKPVALVKAAAKPVALVKTAAAAKPVAAKPVALVKPAAPAVKPLGLKARPMQKARAAVASAPGSKAPVPALRAKYPPNARMLFDRPSNTFRVFVPAAGLSGLGKPTFTVSFGSLGALGAFGAPVGPADVIAKAKLAAAAVQAFVKSHAGKPPAVKLPAVQAFQAAEGQLSVDGLYGSNTRAALAYYTGVALPEPPPALRAKTITWKPLVLAQSPVVQPKPIAAKPIASAPVKPVIVAKPKPIAQPSPTQPTAPSPAVPGYVEVGRERDNPGLTPVGAPETIVGGAQGSRDDRDDYELPEITGGKVIRLPEQEITGRVPVQPVHPGGNGGSRPHHQDPDPIHVTDPNIGPDPALPYWPPNVTTCEDDNTWLWWLLGGYLVYRHTRRRRHA